MENNKKSFICYNKTLAEELINIGFRCTGIAPDKDNNSFNVYFFEDSVDIRQYTRLHNALKVKRIEIERKLKNKVI